MVKILLSIFLFCNILFNYLFADNFLTNNMSYKKTKDNPDIIIFVTAYVIPLNINDLRSTPYGLRLLIDKNLTNKMTTGAASKSYGMYMNGNLVVIKSFQNQINFYRYSRDNSNLYAKIAPSIHNLSKSAGDFYKIDPMPKNISKCNLIISRSFEAPKLSNNELLLNLDDVPNKGVKDMLVECNK